MRLDEFEKKIGIWAEKRGLINIDNVPKQMIDKALKYIRDSTVGQNVGYSPRRGQKGMRGAGGRWAGTYASLIRFGRNEHSDLFKAITPVDQFVTDTGTGHADGMWHYFMVGLSAQFIGEDFNQKFRKQHTSRIYKLQKPDGSFAEIPRLGSEQDPGQGGTAWYTAICCALLAFDYADDLILNDFKKGVNREINKDTLEFVQNILGKYCPKSLKKLVEEAEDIEGKDDISIAKKFKKLYQEKIVKVCNDISELEDRDLAKSAMKRILAYEIGKVKITISSVSN